MTGLAHYNLFCLPPAGLSESREATVGVAVVCLKYDRTEGRAGDRRERRRLLSAHSRKSRQVVLECNEVAETSGLRERREPQESGTMIGPIEDTNAGVTGTSPFERSDLERKRGFGGRGP